MNASELNVTDEQYYSDKTMISQSMLFDFVEYDEYWNRYTYPETYSIKHIRWVDLPKDITDAMMVWTIVDRYIVEWEKVLEEYPVVSRRSGNNPNEITNSMWESVQMQRMLIDNSISFQTVIWDPTTRKQTIFTREINLPNGKFILKWKTDFDNLPKNYIADWKTCWNLNEKMKWLRFKWKVNLFAHNIRQLAYYRFLAEQENNPDFFWVILATDPKGKILAMKVRKDILDRAWKYVYDDLIELREYHNQGFEDLLIDPFDEFEDAEEDDLI